MSSGRRPARRIATYLVRVLAAASLFACAESSLVDEESADAASSRDATEDAEDGGSSDTADAATPTDATPDTLADTADDTPTPDAASDAADTGNSDLGEPDVGNPDTGDPDVGDPDVGDPDTNNPDADADTEDVASDLPLDCGELARCGNECVELLTDPTSCGFCGRTCVIDNADAVCVAGDCQIGACEPGYFDVDGALGNGCEVFDLCEPDEPCFTECGGESVTLCEDGVATCAVPAETCNLADDDCNGACDDGAIAGCRTGIHRAHGNGHIFTDDLEFAGTAPYRVESANYFYLYSSVGASLRPLFLCRKPNGKYLLSTQTACEIGVAPTRTVGYISAENQCGSQPLYRLYHAPTDNHFYTLNAGERDNARDALGYVEQGIAGYVWTAR